MELWFAHPNAHPFSYLSVFEFVPGSCNCPLRYFKNVWLFIVRQHKNIRSGFQLGEHSFRLGSGQCLKELVQITFLFFQRVVNREDRPECENNGWIWRRN